MTKIQKTLIAVISLGLLLGANACSPGKMDVTGVSAIIDTRSAEEFATSHIVGAINNPYAGGDFVANSTSLQKQGKYFIYGADETEAGLACNDLFDRGFTDCTNLGDFENAKRILPLGVTP